ncbi:hypothetical protein [Noviherbaspirillum aerium]|uniref:hypothetical protein n=1 Tax=Noviherbaspirillum aerium TaxID=2588497 RepID=UPI00124E8563|nr:hypothetical protein [Noviherbaspirillum aerium]
MYEYIDHVLGNYFSAGAELSEDEAISILKKHFASSPEFAQGLRTELQRALDDDDYSWQHALAEHDVLIVENEGEARSYVKKILWVPLFTA